MEYVIHGRDDAPEGARASLESIERKYGFIPNLAGTMAQVPELLDAYVAAEAAFRRSALSPVEQEVVALTVSHRNGCRYCMSAHSMLATMSGLGAEDLEALRHGAPLPTARLEALRSFTRTLLEGHGEIADDKVEALLAAGYTREQLLAVPVGVAFKMLSNLTHHLQAVPLDEPMVAFAWEPASSANGGAEAVAAGGPNNSAAESAGDSARVLVSGWLREDGAGTLAAYQAAAGPIMGRHGGKPVFKSKPEVALAGSAADLVVLMEFPSPEAARAAFEDPDYAELIPTREQAFARLDVVTLP